MIATAEMEASERADYSDKWKAGLEQERAGMLGVEAKMLGC